MKTKIWLSLTLSFIAINAFAQMERKLFVLEKNFNPENVMIIHGQTDKDCRFVPSPKNAEGNFVEFYWNMNSGQEKKEVNPTIRGEIKNRFKFLGINPQRDSFRMRLNDLTELKHDLGDTSIEVQSELLNGKCNVKSLLILGASANYRKMNLKRIYCDVSKNLLGIPSGCNFIDLEGQDADNGERILVKFKKK
jgi:hypothetical protein